jgi:hypothetical protein
MQRTHLFNLVIIVVVIDLFFDYGLIYSLLLKRKAKEPSLSFGFKQIEAKGGKLFLTKIKDNLFVLGKCIM